MSSCSYEPSKGEYIVYSKDVGGNEFGQLYSMNLKTLKSTLLTDGGRSQNSDVTWKKMVPDYTFLLLKEMVAIAIYIIWISIILKTPN